MGMVDQIPGAQNGWWTCPQCGSLVPHGSAHQCSHSAIAAAAVKQTNPYEMTLQRIAMALERIAAALERD